MKASKVVGLLAIFAGVVAIGWHFLQPEEEPECLTDADCPAGYVCVKGVCVPEGPPPEKGWIHAIVKECSQIPYEPFPGIRVHANSHNCTTGANGECYIENLDSGTYAINCDIPPGYYSYPELPFNVEVQAGMPVPALILLIPSATGNLEGWVWHWTILGPIALPDTKVTVGGHSDLTGDAHGYGHFKIYNIPVGTYPIEIEYEGVALEIIEGPTEATIIEGETSNITLTVKAP